MTWGQRHPLDLSHVPSADNQPPRIGRPTNPVYTIADLIDIPPVRRRPRPPLVPIDGSQLTLLVGPLVPDAHAVLTQILDVRVASQKPQQLINDRFQMQLFRRHQRKPLRQVKPHLISKNTARSGARAIAFGRSAIQNVLEQFEILTQSAVLPTRGFGNKNRRDDSPTDHSPTHLSHDILCQSLQPQPTGARRPWPTSSIPTAKRL